jgi:hypothetical protein
LTSIRANARAVEPLSPELVLVCPELRAQAPYGPYVPRRPKHVEPLGTGVSARRAVQPRFRLSVLLVALVAGLVKVAFQATVVVLGAAALVAVLFLLARW